MYTGDRFHSLLCSISLITQVTLREILIRSNNDDILGIDKNDNGILDLILDTSLVHIQSYRAAKTSGCYFNRASRFNQLQFALTDGSYRVELV